MSKRDYQILSQTTAATLEAEIKQYERNHKGFRVDGFAFDGTNYVALVSYEV